MRPHRRSRPSATPTAIVALLSLLMATVAVLLPSTPAAAQDASDGPLANFETIAALQSIEAGWQNTCGISDNAQLFCWGKNQYGEVGNGTTKQSLAPAAVTTAGTPLAGTKVSQVAVGQNHACALTSTSTVACWGRNNYGQLGNGTTTDSTTAVAANTGSSNLAGKTIVGIEVGQIHSCALASDSSIACWGHGGNGALGNGSNTNRSTPTDVTTSSTPLDGATVPRLIAGGYGTCALTGAATLSCWGSNAFGELGNDIVPRSLAPAEPTTTGTPLEGKAIADVSVGLYSTCALTTDGVTACWGRNSAGQLGIGNENNRNRPTAVVTAGTPLDGNPPTDLEGDRDNHCAIATDGKPVCWGSNGARQLGISTSPASNSPVPVAVTTTGTPIDGKTIQVIDPGWGHTCAIPADGQAVCWGDNSNGMGGTGTADATPTPTEVLLQAEVPGVPTIVGATPLDGAAALDVTLADGGNLPVTSYLVTPYVDGVAQPTIATSFRSRIFIDDLANGTTYRFQVVALNDAGRGPASALSPPITPVPDPSQAVYVPITPCRIVDTREAGGPFADREIRDYQVTGDGPAFAAQGGKADGCAIPEGTTAVEASVTAVSPADSGFFRAWPSGQSMPNATFMNFDRGMDITNTGALPIADPDGDQSGATNATGDEELRVRNFGGSAQYVIDIQGFYFGIDRQEGAPAPDGATLSAKRSVGVYTPITPCRIVDTRKVGGPFANREIRDYQVTGAGEVFGDQGGNEGGCNIPEGSLAVEASVTAVGPATSGFFRAWPSGQSMPNATFMNFDQAMDITNTGALTLAPEPGHGAGARQELRARNFGGASHYVIDIQGYFTPVDEDGDPEAATNTIGDGALYVPITPCRIVDTRKVGGPFANREIRDYQVAGDGARFADQGGRADGCDIAEEAVAIEGSVTAVGPATSGFFRAWPSGQSMPNATFMNFDQGMDITNTGALTIAELELHGLGTGDQLRSRNFGGASEYVIDIQGYFVAASKPM